MNAELQQFQQFISGRLGAPYRPLCDIYLEGGKMVAYVPAKDADGAEVIELEASGFIEADLEARALGFEPSWG